MTSTKDVTIEILGGRYAGVTWTGDLADAPTTMLVPEGIASARTSEAAERMRANVRAALATHERVEIDSVHWSIRVSRRA